MTQWAVPSRTSPRPITGRMVFVSLVIFFGIITVANVVMIRLAVSTFGGVETESSYKAGLEFAGEIAAARAQQARNWRVTATVTRDSTDRRIEVTALDAGGRPLPGIVATARLAHPTDRRLDHVVDLNAVRAGYHRADAIVPAGQWYLVVELTRDGERMFRSRSRIVLP